MSSPAASNYVLGQPAHEFIRHKIRDYGQWRPIFDRHTKMQKAAGLSNPRVYHSADSNKSEIVVVFDTKDTKMAKDFAASVDLKEAMTEGWMSTCQRSIFLIRSIGNLFCNPCNHLSFTKLSSRCVSEGKRRLRLSPV